MIDSAEEFVRLRTSEDPAEYWRAAHDEAAADATWRDVIERYPEMRVWMAHNKTVPISIVVLLRRDADERVRWMVRSRRSWARAHPEDSGQPETS